MSDKKRNISKGALLLIIMCTTLMAFAPNMKFDPLANYQNIFAGRNKELSEKHELAIHLDSIKNGEYAYPLKGSQSGINAEDLLQVVSQKDKHVKAIFAGRVRVAASSPLSGSFVVITHDNGLETFYRNIHHLNIHVGDRVKAGQIIADADKCQYGYTVGVMFLINGTPIHPFFVFDTYAQRPLNDVLRCKLTDKYLITTTSKRVAFTQARKRFLATLIASLDPVKSKYFGAAGPAEINLEFLNAKHWCYPLVGSYVTSPYDKLREKPDTTATYHHTGVDIKTHTPHDSIHVAFDGIVEESCPVPGYGNCIMVKHAYGIETLYGHQTVNFVHAGQHVKAGQVIGLTGATGHATGDHLHFEMLYRGQRIDPALFFDHKKHTLRRATVFLHGPKVISKPNDERNRYLFGWKIA